MTGFENLPWQPAPLPAGASETARRHVAVANLIPPGWWATYGDIGEAAGGNGRGCAVTLGSVTPMVAKDANDTPDRWVVPWHRIAMADGSGKTRDADNRGRTPAWYRMVNELLRAEGGQGEGHRTEYRHFDLVAHVGRLRRAGWNFEPLDPETSTPAPPGTVSPERRAAMEARLAERRR